MRTDFVAHKKKVAQKIFSAHTTHQKLEET